MPGIKVKKNSIIMPNNNKIKETKKIDQTKDSLRWKKKRKYGKRWIVETTFYIIKIMFEEHTSATRF